MTLKNLEDVYRDQLQELWSASTRVIQLVTRLSQAAHDSDLIRALIAGAKGLGDGSDKGACIWDAHEIDSNSEHCRGMEGPVAETRAHLRDAMIITQSQCMMRCPLVHYGGLVAFANRIATMVMARSCGNVWTTPVTVIAP